MHRMTTVLVYLATGLLLTFKLVASEWTFSLRISSAQCCSNTRLMETCGQVGACDDLFLLLCLREPNRATADRENCPSFIAGDGNAIINRRLTPASIVDSSLLPIGITSVSTPYQGGFQIYIGIVTMQELPRLPEELIIDEIFVEIVTAADGRESSVTVNGEDNRVNMTISSISVECSPGYGGDDCQTLNTCSEEIICNKTLGYCDSDGECICYEEDTECATERSSTEPPSESTEPPSGSSSNNDTVPVIVGVVVTVVLVLIVLVIIAVVVFILYRRKRKQKKRIEMTIITGPLDKSSTTSTPPNPMPEILYSTVNKDKKKRVPPKMPEPYQIPISENDESNGVVEDVSYATTQHNRESPEDGDEVSNGEAPVRNSRGLVYADLDLHTTGNPGPPKPPRPDVSSPQPLATVAYTTVNPYSTPRTPPQAAKKSGDSAYYSVVRS